MFVITVNLGDFQLLQSRYGTNQVAVLVEARSGPTLGTILQHPMIETRRRNGADMTGERYQIPPDLMARLFDGRDVDYLDPLSNADGGDAYDGQWIAAMHSVSLPKRSRVPNGEQQVDDPESQQISDLGLDSQVLSPAEGNKNLQKQRIYLCSCSIVFRRSFPLYQECDLHFLGRRVCIGFNFAGHIGALVGRSEV